MKKAIAVVVLAATCGVALAACTADETSGQQAAQDIAKNRQVFVPKNDVEGRNYNARQSMADNPATLIWCTAYPTNPNAKAFTVPIVGKLTSGNKRPYATSQVKDYSSSDSGTYNPELPGPDGMYGTSGEYRYGFDPAGNYHDYYNIETYCTSVPDVIQKETTTIVVKVAGDLATADAQAQTALAACVAKAGKDAGGASKYDPSKACPQAAALLGMVAQ